MAERARNSYDEVPYLSSPIRSSHPDRLATEAALAGLQPAEVSNCRVLELGCGNGGNLLPMAQTLPASRFTGIDLSPRQIAQGKENVAAIGLTNLDLRAMSIMEVDSHFGEFDFIICHGVYSWVPPDVQDRIMDICRRNLAPQGVAYISYNTYPGWHRAGLIREMLHYHARPDDGPAEQVRQARAFLAFLVDATGADADRNPVYSRILKEEAGRLRDKPDWYFYHEYLEQDNHPIYFSDFMERARAHRLQYLAESSPAGPPPLSPSALQSLEGLTADPIRREQYLDFLCERSFRRTLLCREEIRLDNSSRGARLARLPFLFDGELTPVSERPEVDTDRLETFRAPDSTLNVTSGDRVVKAVFTALASAHPKQLPLDALRAEVDRRLAKSSWVRETPGEEQTRQVVQCLLRGHDLGLVDIHLHRFPFVLEAGNRPRATALARLQASRGGPVANLTHKLAGLDDFDMLVLTYLDGQHDRAQLLARLEAAARDGRLVPREDGQPIQDPGRIRAAIEDYLRHSLRKLAALALLIG